MPAISVDASVGAIEGAELDVDAGDIIDNLDLGGMINLEAHHKDGLGFSLAYNFMDLSIDVSGSVEVNASVKCKNRCIDLSISC